MNSKNVRRLWTLSSILATHDTCTAYDHPLCAVPVLNFEKIRLFDQAILGSKADEEKHRWLTREEFENVLNDCVDVGYDPGWLDGFKSATTDEQKSAEEVLLFARMANVQFPAQEPRVAIRIGRAIAMLESLPVESPETLPTWAREDVLDLLGEVREFLGAAFSKNEYPSLESYRSEPTARSVGTGPI